MKETKLFELVTDTKTKPWLSGNMQLYIYIYIYAKINGRISQHIPVVALNLLELTQFAWPNLSIYFNFLCTVPRGDVIKRTRFLMRPPVIIYHTAEVNITILSSGPAARVPVCSVSSHSTGEISHILRQYYPQDLPLEWQYVQ